MNVRRKNGVGLRPSMEVRRSQWVAQTFLFYFCRARIWGAALRALVLCEGRHVEDLSSILPRERDLIGSRL